jgi:hypothetical protein
MVKEYRTLENIIRSVIAEETKKRQDIYSTPRNGNETREKIKTSTRLDDSRTGEVPTRQGEIKTKVVDEAARSVKPFKPFKANPRTVSAYQNRSTDELHDMHSRWSKDHSNPKNDPITSEKLLAVHEILRSRGHDVTLPNHRNLGV